MASEDDMTRRDWWLGVTLVLLGLAVGFAIVIHQLDQLLAENELRMRPLAAVLR